MRTEIVLDQETQFYGCGESEYKDTDDRSTEVQGCTYSLYKRRRKKSIWVKNREPKGTWLWTML